MASKPSLAAIAGVYFRIGNSTFGSGNTTSVLIGEELDRRNWLGRAQFDLCFTVARFAPGTNLFSFVAATAWYLRGWMGAGVALTALSLPASVIVVILTLACQALESHPVGHVAMGMAMASIVGIMAGAAWLLMRPFVRQLRTLFLVAGAAVASLYAPPLFIMLCATIVGFVWQGEKSE